jgi:peptidoglycan/LPS O-acetylase OafA/YrhL
VDYLPAFSVKGDKRTSRKFRGTLYKLSRATMKTKRVEFANLLRGIAALSVVLSHYLGAFWYFRDEVASLTGLVAVEPQAIPTPIYVSWINQIPGIYKGGFGVGLFFVISGFVIPFSFLHYTRTGFVISRIFRLWPTYAVGFAITVGTIATGAWLSGRSLPFTFNEALIHDFLGVRDLLGVRSIDGIIWTLEIEIKFYLVAGIIAPWLQRGSLWAFTAPAIAWFATVACGWVMRMSYHNYFPVSAQYTAYSFGLETQFIVFIFIGVALNFAYRGLQPFRRIILVCLLLLVAFLSLFWIGAFREPRYGLTYLVALGAFLLLYLFPQLLPNLPPLKWLADISYSLYICHGVAGYVVMTLLLRAGISPITTVAVTTGAAVFIATVLYRLVERPTRHFGQQFATRFSEPEAN